MVKSRIVRAALSAASVLGVVSGALLAANSASAGERGATGYPVQVGKVAVQSTQVRSTADAAPVHVSSTAGSRTNYAIQVGKVNVTASRVTPGVESRTSIRQECRDFLVQAGKRTVWASTIAPICPTGADRTASRCCSEDSGTASKSSCCR